MTARKPVPGDVVLIRATVVDQGREYVPVDDLWVSVRATDCEPERVLVSTGLIADVLGPPWFPPEHGDVVLDNAGDPWQYDAGPRHWSYLCVQSRSTEDLIRDFGPLILIARGGKPVTS